MGSVLAYSHSGRFYRGFTGLLMAFSRARNRSDTFPSGRPAEIIRLTDPGCPMARLLAIQSLDTVVFYAESKPAGLSFHRSSGSGCPSAPRRESSDRGFHKPMPSGIQTPSGRRPSQTQPCRHRHAPSRLSRRSRWRRRMVNRPGVLKPCRSGHALGLPMTRSHASKM